MERDELIQTITQQLKPLVEAAEEIEDALKVQAALADNELDRLAARLALEYHREELKTLRDELAYYEAMGTPLQ